MSQLVVDPNRYVINYLGVKNSDDLEIALEIYLADKVFNPKFLNLSNDLEDKFDYILGMYHDVNHEGLNSLFYFHFLDFSVESGLLDMNLIDDFMVCTAENILRNTKRLKSTVANNILKTNDFYQAVHREKLEIIEDEDVAKKVMGLITLHNKELYKLNSLKMVELDEYKIFESFKDEFIQAEDSILVKNYVC